MTGFSFLMLVFFCHFCCIISLSHALNKGFSVELIHRDSSKSPLYNPKETQFQRVANAVRRSVNRANHFNKASVHVQTPVSTVSPANGEYLMTYSVGTPPFKQYGIVDTGSDIVWLQCKPCVECFNQTSPIFDPSKSSTYKTIPCHSTACTSISSTSCSGNSGDQICEYSIQYGDQSFSQGDLSLDTFTLDSTTGSAVSFPKTKVGCGHDNTVSFSGKGSGIVGLGGGPLSLITQLGSSIGGKFSYCMIPFLLNNSTSKLNFGEAAVVSGRGTVSTPIAPQSDSNIFYYLNLEAFSVGSQRIEFGDPPGEGNIIIDSGTTLTLLYGDIYSKLEAAVKKVVKLKPAADPSHILSLCYESTSNIPDVPVITAHFNGADVHLNPVNTFVQVAEGIVCFAFARTPEDDAIFGNIAQQNFLVGYDLQKKTVSFKPTDCTKQ